MFKKTSLAVIGANLMFLGLSAQACMDHYFYDRGNYSLSPGANAYSRMVRPVVKEKVFKVKHPATTIAIIDEDTNLDVKYELPAESKNVSLAFKGSKNVELLDDRFTLSEENGTITARFRVKQKGVDTITVTVSGEHEGEMLTYSSKVYIGSKAASS